MIRYLFISICVVILYYPANCQDLWKEHEKKAKKELQKWSHEFSDVEFIESKDSREYFKIITATGKESAILVLSAAKGRFDNFDLMTVVASGKIDLIHILKYRSEYGSEISNKKWLSQFYHSTDSTFVLRKNIDAVSGATFSAGGLVEEINKILQSLKHP